MKRKRNNISLSRLKRFLANFNVNLLQIDNQFRQALKKPHSRFTVGVFEYEKEASTQ